MTQGKQLMLLGSQWPTRFAEVLLLLPSLQSFRIVMVPNIMLRVFASALGACSVLKQGFGTS